LQSIELLEKISLGNAANKQIRNFSSGMKQRLKLALAIFDQAPILLLDEPCSNLDQEGIQTYHQLMQAHVMHKLIIVASNDPQEYQFCSQQLSLSDFKK
jgi:ABC-type multidrug transport system ATPase subunit